METQHLKRASNDDAPTPMNIINMTFDKYMLLNYSCWRYVISTLLLVHLLLIMAL